MIAGYQQGLSWGGSGTISGTITVNAVQAQKRVLLFARRTNRCLRATVSAADGSYAFTLMDASKKYYVVAFDDDELYNAKIADHLTAAVP